MTALPAIQSANNASATASVTATFPGSAPRPNNLLLAVVLVVGSVAPTITGWSVVATDLFNTSGQRLRMLAKNAGASESSTVQADSAGATVMQILISEWAGLWTTTADRTVNEGSNSATLVLSRSTGTTAPTTVDDGLAVAAWGFGGGVSSLSYSNGFANSLAGPSRIRQAERLSVPIGTSVESTASWVTSRTAGGLVAVFKPLINDRWGSLPL